MKASISSVKGTREFYPEDMAVRYWLYQQIRSVSESFGYQEYDGPFLEKIDLYAAKSGEELVKDQAFVFPDRKGDLITLRPELTPSLARLVAQRQSELTFPLRWWSFGPFWRYEQPQKGRTREFFQWNIDVIGTTSPETDAELLAVCAGFLKQVGLTPQQVKVKVNNRRLMDSALQELSISAELKGNVFRLIDRRDKMKPDAWETFASDLGLNKHQVEGLKILLTESELWKKSTELTRIFHILDKMGLLDYIDYDPEIIRGLDYYTGTVFEARDMDGGRAILGGGRYDNLVGDVGGNPLPGVGFAMGDVMMTLVLQKYGVVPQQAVYPARIMVAVFNEQHLDSAFSLAAELRQAGLNVACYPEAVKLPRQYKYADRTGARFVVVEGPDEEIQGVVAIKDLIEGTQELFPRQAAASVLLQKVGQ